MAGRPRPERSGASRFALLCAALAAPPWCPVPAAQSAHGPATMTVAATVIRSCIVETGAAPAKTAPDDGRASAAPGRVKVTLACSQNTLSIARQTLTGSRGALVDTPPSQAGTISFSPDGRVLIQF